MDKVRLGVIGTGLAWERLHYPAIQELKDKYEIAALANRTRQDAAAFAEKIRLNPDNVYEDYSQMLKRDDIDAFDILVPIELNYKVSENVAQTGKPFICEKPLAPDRRQVDRYLKLFRNYPSPILIAENYRYNEENRKIKELVDSGKIGDVVYFINNNINCFPCQMTKDTFAGTEWRQHPDFPGGAFLDAALHDIAAMKFIFGPVKCVQAFGKPQKEDFMPYRSLSCSLLFENGVTGQYTYFPSGFEPQRPLVGFRIFGTEGEIYLEEKTCGIINIAYNNAPAEQVSFIPERGYFNELLNFYNAVAGNEKVLVTPEVEANDVLTVLDLLDAAGGKKVVFSNQSTQQVYGTYNTNIGTQNYLQ